MTDKTEKNHFNANTEFLRFKIPRNNLPITSYKDYQSDANWIVVLANQIAAFKRSNTFKNTRSRHNKIDGSNNM